MSEVVTPSWEPCSVCDGDGTVILAGQEVPCLPCGGEGWVMLPYTAAKKYLKAKEGDHD